MAKKRKQIVEDIYKDKPDYLTTRQYIFLEEYMKTGEKRNSAIKAGYPERSASSQASRELSKSECKRYLTERREAEGSRVASTDECLEYLTRVIRGEEKDAFDLDISASDKMKAVSMLLDRLEGMNNNAGQVTIINNIPRTDTVPDTIIDINPN